MAVPGSGECPLRPRSPTETCSSVLPEECAYNPGALGLYSRLGERCAGVQEAGNLRGCGRREEAGFTACDVRAWPRSAAWVVRQGLAIDNILWPLPLARESLILASIHCDDSVTLVLPPLCP